MPDLQFARRSIRRAARQSAGGRVLAVTILICLLWGFVSIPAGVPLRAADSAAGSEDIGESRASAFRNADFRDPNSTILAACNDRTILFVGRTTPLGEYDQPIVDRIRNAGNSVIERNHSNVTAADAIGVDLVMISQSVYSTEIEDMFRNAEVPLLTWEAWLLDNLGMTGAEEDKDIGEVVEQDKVKIVNSGHPMAAGFSGEVKTIEHKSKDEISQWGVPNENAIIIATLKGGKKIDAGSNALSDDEDEDNRIAIFGYEAGAAMVGMNAPARRVFIHNASGDNMTNEGWELLNAAAVWATNCNEPEPSDYTVSITVDGSGTVTKTTMSTRC